MKVLMVIGLLLLLLFLVVILVIGYYAILIFLPLAISIVLAIIALAAGHDNVAVLLIVAGLILMVPWKAPGGWLEKIENRKNK